MGPRVAVMHEVRPHLLNAVAQESEKLRHSPAEFPGKL